MAQCLKKKVHLLSAGSEQHY